MSNCSFVCLVLLIDNHRCPLDPVFSICLSIKKNMPIINENYLANSVFNAICRRERMTSANYVHILLSFYMNITMLMMKRRGTGEEKMIRRLWNTYKVIIEQAIRVSYYKSLKCVQELKSIKLEAQENQAIFCHLVSNL